MPLNQIKMRKWLASNQVQIEQIDEKFLMAQLSIALEAYKRSGYPNSGALGNLIGIVGEYAFDGFLDHLGLKDEANYEWNKRKINHNKETVIERPFDFRLSKASDLTIEIGTAKPFHKYAILKDSKHKIESKFFVQMQIDHLRCWSAIPWQGRNSWVVFDASAPEAQELSFQDLESFKPTSNNAIGLVTIKGYDEIAKITNEENGWKYGFKGNLPTTQYDGWYKAIDALEPISYLEKIISAARGTARKRQNKKVYSKQTQEPFLPICISVARVH